MPTHDATRRSRGRPRTPDVDDKVRAATRALVEALGYDATTIDAIATRAGAAKTAIYRRWPNKAALVYDAVLLRDGAQNTTVPDSGDLRADLLTVVGQNAEPLRDPKSYSLLARLVAEAASDDVLADALRTNYFEPRAELIAQRVRIGIERGEVAATIDAELVPALLTGPLQYLRLVRGSHLEEVDLERIVDGVLGPHLT